MALGKNELMHSDVATFRSAEPLADDLYDMAHTTLMASMREGSLAQQSVETAKWVIDRVFSGDLRLHGRLLITQD